MKNVIKLLCGAVAILTASASLKAQAHLEIFSSPNLHCDDTVAVYSPSRRSGSRLQGVKVQKNIPTLFLLHGYSGNWRDWGSHTDLQALADKTGWRIITPDGFYKSWYLDDADPDKMQWRKFFWEECYPKLNEDYGLDPEKTFITGLSMGGHGAMNIFLDHPELFKGAGSMSGVLDLRYSGGSKSLIPEILGRKNIEKCDDQSAIYRLENLTKLGPIELKKKIIVVSCGTEDYTFCAASRIFEARCHELGIGVTAHYRPGKHNWEFWPYILPYFISWFDETLEK